MKTLNLKVPSFKTTAICALQAIALASLVYISAFFCGIDECFIGFDEAAKRALQQSWIALIPLFALPIAGKLAAESTSNARLIYNPLLRWPMRIGGAAMSLFFFIALKNRYLPLLGRTNDTNVVMLAILTALAIAYFLYRIIRWYVDDRGCFKNAPVSDAVFNWSLPTLCSGAAIAGFAAALLVAGIFIVYIMSAVMRRY